MPSCRRGHLHQRQVVNSVRAPPISGPASRPKNDRPSTMPRYPIRFNHLVTIPKLLFIRVGLLPACLAGSTISVSMIKPPPRMPAPPTPATARPTISIVEHVAAPHRAEPISKTPKNARNVHYPVKCEVSGHLGGISSRGHLLSR